MIFLEKNHIQGKTDSDINIALVHSNEIKSLVCFKKIDQKEFEMVRVATINNYQVVDGYEIIFDYFIKKYLPLYVFYSHDKRWGKCKEVEKLGFKNVGETEPHCYSIIDNVCEMIEDGSDYGRKIYDCGSVNYMWKTNDC